MHIVNKREGWIARWKIGQIVVRGIKCSQEKGKLFIFFEFLSTASIYLVSHHKYRLDFVLIKRGWIEIC